MKQQDEDEDEDKPQDEGGKDNTETHEEHNLKQHQWVTEAIAQQNEKERFEQE